jgi:hypothetical protein
MHLSIDSEAVATLHQKYHVNFDWSNEEFLHRFLNTKLQFYGCRPDFSSKPVICRASFRGHVEEPTWWLLRREWTALVLLPTRDLRRLRLLITGFLPEIPLLTFLQHCPTADVQLTYAAHVELFGRNSVLVVRMSSAAAEGNLVLSYREDGNDGRGDNWKAFMQVKDFVTESYNTKEKDGEQQ